jgi:threonylcarbamoyladenosine tRNA methylthiotransferase MtaB
VSRVEVITYGCRLNIAESEAIAAMLADADDLVVINSCAVTAEAVKTARAAIRRARRARPTARIVVTGCAAQVEPETFGTMVEVSGVVANAAKLDPYAYGAGAWTDPSTARHAVGHARTFLPVQNGCDHRCTFCIIPYGRGPSRSEPAGGVIDRIRQAVDAGTQEIVLTGVDLTAYGSDLPGRGGLGLLVERILRHVPDLPRLRLSSLDPCEVDDRLADLIAYAPRVMPHLHLSLQAGSDLVLKRMKRRHLRGDAVALVDRLRASRPDIAIGADLIAGFPTEDEAMFADTLALIDDCAIVFAHVFPYSPRAGTPAARMPQVERAVIKARAAQLRDHAAGFKRRWLQQQIGTMQQVLVELDGTGGHAPNFARVAVAGPPNTIISARIVGVDGDTLVGMPA